METVRFRHNVSIAILGAVMFCGGLALATSRWYLAPVLLVPLAMIVWGWRAGTDVDARGLRLRALVGSRRLAWPEITGFDTQKRRVLALLTSGRAVALPAVGPEDLPRLLAAGSQPNTLPEPAVSGDDELPADELNADQLSEDQVPNDELNADEPDAQGDADRPEEREADDKPEERRQ